jgi:hypothetical protein
LVSPEYKGRIEAQQTVQKAIADKTAASNALSEADFNSAVGARLVQEQTETARRQKVYTTPMKRYQAILDTILSGDEPSSQDRFFKVDYESRMGEIEKARWEVYTNFYQGAENGSS